MKIRLICLVAVLATGVAANLHAAPYAQLSSTETQVATTSPKYVDACRNAAARTAGSWHMVMNPIAEPMLVPKSPSGP